MFKSLSVVSLVATIALAQSTTLIPAGISEKCSTFLTGLNENAELAKCTSALSTALAAFAPEAATAATPESVSGALNDVCGPKIAAECPTSTFASQITAFYSACSDELVTNPNADVIKIYDVLYVVPAMRESICSKDDDGSWCVAKATPTPGSSAESVQAALFTKSGDNIIPNTSTFTTHNLLFLFLTPDSPDLCKTCTRNVLKAFINHESNLPYAPGLSNSQLLNTQAALYAGVQKNCGETFMMSEVTAAGGLSQNGLNGLLGGGSSGAMPHVDAAFSSMVAAVAGFATFAALL